LVIAILPNIPDKNRFNATKKIKSHLLLYIVSIFVFLTRFTFMRNTLFLLLVLGILITLPGCKAFEGAQITANPDPLEVVADSIAFTVEVNIPPKSGFKKDGRFNGDLVIKNGDKVFPISSVSISTEKEPDIKKNGLKRSLYFKSKYDPEMMGGKLTSINSYERKGKKFELPEFPLATCCKATSEMIKEDLQTLETAASRNEYKKEVPLHLEAVFNFPKDIFAIQANQYEQKDIVAIGEFLKQKYNATSMGISGFASPEGRFDRNVFLSVNRSKEVQNWLITQLRQAGYTNYLDSTFFKITTTSEDWEGFKSALDKKGYNQDIKTQIITILSAGLTEDEKESKIMSLVGGSKEVEIILAPLRRATISLDGFEARKTDLQIDSLAVEIGKGNITTGVNTIFEKEEWLYAIGRLKNQDYKKKNLDAFLSVYGTDYRALNDRGVISVKEGKNSEAKDFIDRAAQAKSGDYIITNNLGVTSRLIGKDDEAQGYFENSLATRSTPEANYNTGVLLEKSGKYSESSGKFDAAKGINNAPFNGGLSKLLLGDINGARTNLETYCKNNQKDPEGFYLLAVLGARSGDLDMTVLNLKKVAELNAKMAQKAQIDPEFAQFWEKAEFKAATKN